MERAAIMPALSWGYSSAGRPLAWHARGHRFDPGYLHQQNPSATLCPQSPSSRGLGHRPFTAVTGLRLPAGTPNKARPQRRPLFGRPTGHENPAGFDNAMSGGHRTGRRTVLRSGGLEPDCGEGCADRGGNAKRAQSPWGRQKNPPNGGFFYW